ncbi:metallophosphoesterase family protein [Paenibacillus sp. Leaf72]|uniref:metallophosphoesterase family protein n=1 Tax=Paenibacillus sp. Leaf72 TaxID=1736234 RepID=UPI0006FA4FA5|nr:metallophosphoesterase family protein [Paenibacillus sp. Leaf72]KQO18389.1 metallophosphoesterase [Paenibacillus sp. Leaf72]
MTKLKFQDDGTFTIVQFTDLHWKNGEQADLQTYSLMKNILQAEMPELVIFTGDVIHSEECISPKESYMDAIKIAEELSIPWAAVFGNHDAEQGCSKEELISLQQRFPFCLTKKGPELDNRYGNCVLEIGSKNSTSPAAALYLLDSGSHSTHPIGGYEWITPRQISWYQQQSQRLTGQNNGLPLPSLAFFHIPLPEYNEVWNYHRCYGHNYEGMGCPKVNSGLFTAFLEMNDVRGVFVGHDHINDFWGELHSINLYYGRATGYNSYGKEGFARGARIIQLTEGEQHVQSWLRLDDGSVIINQPEHLPEHVWRRV